MSKRKSAKSTNGFLVNQCSLCEQFALTVGQQQIGGVRYCQDCIKETLAWVQMGDATRAALLSMFTQHSTNPIVIKALEVAKQFSPELLKSNAIGEARRRLVESERSS